MLLIHHLLEHGSGVDSRHVVVFEGWHEGHSTRGHHEILRINVGHLTSNEILHSNAWPFQDIPHCGVQQDAFLAVSCKSFSNIKASHAAIFFLLLKEKELVGLHIELSSDTWITVNDKVINTKGIQLLTTSKSGRACADDSHLGLVDLHRLGCLLRTGRRLKGDSRKIGFMSDGTYLTDAIYSSDTDATHAPVDQHLASAALADAALQRAVAPLK